MDGHIVRKVKLVSQSAYAASDDERSRALLGQLTGRFPGQVVSMMEPKIHLVSFLELDVAVLTIVAALCPGRSEVHSQLSVLSNEFANDRKVY